MDTKAAATHIRAAAGQGAGRGVAPQVAHTAGGSTWCSLVLPSESTDVGYSLYVVPGTRSLALCALYGIFASPKEACTA
jgi:hypothetical protein